MSEIKHIDIAEFRTLGILQEVNRLFFHPLGLALEVTVEDKDCTSCGGEGSFRGTDCNVCEGKGKIHTEHLSGLWDCRDDPEGVLFATGEIEQAYIDRVATMQKRLIPGRELALGEGRFIQVAKDRV